ncbi:MAG: hypothetical protein IJC78_01890 [Clostridia bacterium]|nr:hypothetical protein [Clostridia bacterium]
MKSMKKVLSLLLSLMMVAAMFVMPTTAAAWEARTNEVDLRLGLLNDTHITSSGSGEALNITALTTLKALGMEKLAFVGDNVYYTKATDTPLTDRVGYQKLWAGLETAGWTKEDVIAYAMGNHEFPQGSGSDATTSANSITAFEEEYGPRNQHTTYNGFHMITGGPETYNNVHSRAMEKYYMEEIDKALCEDSTNETEGRTTVYDNGTAEDTSDDTLAVVYEGGVPNSTKPVLLFLHQPMAGTLANQTGSHYSAEFKAFLAARPQVVFITAHKHLLAQHPDIIGQDAGFTAFQSPMTAGGYQSQWGYTKESEITDSQCSQGSFLEIKDNVVYLYRLDYKNGSYIGEPFVVDIPKIVADRLTEDTADDYNNMPYRYEVRDALTSTAAFPEGAAVTVETQGTAATVKFPNSATMTSYDPVQQDNFIRGYKIEVLQGTTAVVTSTFQADFWKAPANRATTYSKSVGGLSYNTEYTVNVYPRAPFGAYGAPITTTFKTEEEVIQENAVRYEVEDYCPETKLNKATEYASGGGLCISAQGGKVSGVTYLARDAYTSPFTFDIPISVPVDGYYGFELAMGYRNSGNNVSEVSFILDKDTANVTLANNLTKGDEDRSLNNTYPWNEHIPLMHYTAADQLLTAGDHTVTVSVNAPTNTGQPYLFCADYVEVIPRTPFIGLDGNTTIEMENYVDQAVVPQTDGTTYKGRNVSTASSSGGKYLLIDSDDGIAAVDYIDITVPIYVENEGYYDMTSYACQLPDTSIYLDSTDTELNTTYTRTTNKEKNAAGKYACFASGWAYVNIDTTKQVRLPQGAHNLIVRVYKRGDGDIAQYLDCIKFVPATDILSANGSLHYEAEDYADRFKGTSTAIVAGDVNASGGLVIYRGSGSKAIAPTFVFAAEEAGTYTIEYSAATDLSTITPTMDGTALTTTSTANLYKHHTHYNMRIYKANVELTAGLHELVFNTALRKDGSLAYSYDYFHISKKVDEVITQQNKTRIEFEKYANMDVKTLSAASGGKYVYNNYGSKDSARVIQAQVEIRDSGYYNIEYLVGNKSLYSNPNYVASIAIYLGDTLIGKNDGTHYENIKSADGFSWGTAPMCRYFKDAVWLDAGVYTLDAKVTRAESHPDKVYNYQMDYIEFRPVDKIELLGTSYITAHINSKDAMTGTAIFAFYNGDELLKVETKDVTNARYVTISAAKSTATHVKAFVIDGYENVTPLVTHQEYSLAEE